MTDEELAKSWARCMRSLRSRDLVRTANTPVGDYAERICCDRFNLEREGFSKKSIDAVASTGLTYQIRLITRRGFGYNSPEAVIALAMLCLGGLCPPLPGR